MVFKKQGNLPWWIQIIADMMKAIDQNPLNKN